MWRDISPMWRDIRTMCRYSPFPWILVPIEMAILLSALTVLPCAAAEEYSRWRSGSPKPRRSPFWKFARWLPVPIVSVPICFGITVFIIPFASHSCCFGSEETPSGGGGPNIEIIGSHSPREHVQSRTDVVIDASCTVTWKPSDGKQQTVCVITTDGDNLRVVGSEGSTMYVIGPKHNRHSYLVLEGTLSLKASWKPCQSPKQSVDVVVHADGKVNVAPESVQQCGAKGEKLDFGECRIRLGDIPLKIALGQGFWKQLSSAQVVTPTPETAQQSPSQRAAHIPPPQPIQASSPSSHLVEVLTFDAMNKLVTLSSTAIAR